MSQADAATGAIRMVAFGVLEYDPPVSEPFLFPGKNNISERADAAREVLALVGREVEALGWALTYIMQGQSSSRRPRKFMLLGPALKTNAFIGRVKIGEGSLLEVCKRAVEYLDGPFSP